MVYQPHPRRKRFGKMNIEKLTKNFLKTRVAGAGDEVLLEPPLETPQLLMSVESFSVVDLLAEGPIGGIVDRDGAYADGDRALCGLYLDQVPVRETISQESFIYNSFPSGLDSTQPLATDLTGLSNILSQYDTQFSAIYTDSDTEIPDVDKLIAQNAYGLNRSIQDLLKHSINEEAYLIRGNTAFFSDSDIKYAFIPATGIDISALNISQNNVSIRVMYSGLDGSVDLLSNRYRKPSEKNGEFDKMMVGQIPDPIINFAYKTSTASLTSEVTSIRNGYVIIPLASGDVLTQSGNNIVFSGVDSECVDITSSNLSGAKIFLQSFSENTENTYNYDKIELETRNGEENQAPLFNVPMTSRTYDVSFQLQGAVTPASYSDKYDPVKQEQELSPATASQAYTSNNRLVEENFDYAAWAKDSFNNYQDERATYTHIVESSMVTQVSVTYTLSSLYDTVVQDKEPAKGKVGTQTVALLEMGIEIGLDGDNDPKDPLYETLRQYHKTVTFGVEGLVRSSPFRFRVGGAQKPSARSSWIAPTRGSRAADLDSLPLPPEVQGRKRYIKIYRRTPETFSSKRSISIALSAINEYYGKIFNYPLSSIGGVNIDSRAFSRVPSRAYDLRLKKVLIPSNYYPLKNNGIDKRFIKNKNDYDADNPPQIYRGDWDGTFRYEWTDNPAWILYDMLVDPVYAIGNQIDDLRDINIWQLYEIGKFCDGVNDSGEFVGVEDGYGGLEPRFSCNVMINNEQEAYDILNSIATVFRGTVFYAGSDIDFYYDVESEPIAFFNNQNVENGEFVYSDSLKSSRYTVVEVPYIDKNDNYLQKIEYYEDEESIQRYGYIKHTFQGIGITSRGQAQRFARYALMSNKLETEQAHFKAGRNTALLQPSDVIRISDELKNIQAVGGYVSDVDYDSKKIIMPYLETGGLDTGLYLYCETGENAIETLFEEAYDNAQTISQNQIDSLNTTKIKLFQVDSYQVTGTNNGGTGIVANLNTGQDGIDRISDVQAGSFVSIKATGRNDHLYKIVSISEDSDGKYDIQAIQYEPRKFALAESGIRFSEEEEFFANLAVDYNSNTPDAPSSVSLTGGVVSQGQSAGVYLTGDITEPATFPLAEKYECQLLSPKGKKTIKSIDNSASVSQVTFGPFYEFGTYSLSVYSYSAEPLKLRSISSSDASGDISLGASKIYDYITIESINFNSGITDYAPASDNTSATGTVDMFAGTLAINWTLRDKIGQVLTTPKAVKDNFDNPVVSVDLRKTDGTYVATDILHKTKEVSTVIPKDTLLSVFGGAIPRDFEVVIRVSGDSQPDEVANVIQVSNPEPELKDVGVSSSYDSLANGFRIWANAEKRYRDDIEIIHIYSGSSGEFIPSDEDNPWLSFQVGQQSALVRKSANLLSRSYMPEFSTGNNDFYSFDSIKDGLFFQGENVEVVSNNSVEEYPSGISGDTVYELIMGKTFDSFLYLEAERGYSNESGGISNQSYLTSSSLRNTNDAYYPFEKLQGIVSNSAGGTGLISGSQYPTIRDAPRGINVWNNDYSGFWDSGWVDASDIDAGGVISGTVLNDIAGYRTWTGNRVFFYGGAATGIFFVRDDDYGFNRAADKSSSSKSIFLDDGGSFRLAEERSAGNYYSLFQQKTPAFAASCWVRPLDTSLPKQYLFDCGGKTGGWSLYLSGKNDAGNPSGDFRLDIRLAAIGGGSGELVTVEGSNAWELGKWMHMGIDFHTATGATTRGVANVYINGEIYASGSGVGSGTNEHHWACGVGLQMGQSVSGAGNDGDLGGSFTGNHLQADVADVAYFNAKFSDAEMRQNYFGLRNQYALRLSTGNWLEQGVSGENVSTSLSVVSQENRVIKLEVSNTSGPTESPVSVLGQISNTFGTNGIKKQFSLKSNVSVENANFQNIINNTFYLEEVDYLSKNYVWSMIENEDFKMHYTSGVGEPHGKWSIYSGDTGSIIYQYTGANATDAGYINTTSLEDASGAVPAGASMKTGASGYSLGYPNVIMPQVSTVNPSDNKSVLYSDFYIRLKPEDYIGKTEEYYPTTGLGAIEVNFAELGEASPKAKALQALSAGEQLQFLIAKLQNAAATGIDYSGFKAALIGEFADAVETPANPDAPAEATTTSTPTIISSLNYTVEAFTDSYDAVIQVEHPDPDVDVYISTTKSDVENGEASALFDTQPATPTYKQKTLTLSTDLRNTIWVTAKAAGKRMSLTDSETVRFTFEGIQI